MTGSWTRVCALADLTPERGRAALLPGGEQAALFLLADGSVRAVSNLDPYSGANVLSRGLVGSATFSDGTEVATVISPLHKQAWDLMTGAVVRTQGRDERAIRTYPVAIDDGAVLLRAAGAAGAHPADAPWRAPVTASSGAARTRTTEDAA